MEYSSTTGINIHEYTVSELNKAIQGTLEGKFENIRVRGEISGLNKAASGHVYLSLKDNDSIISAVIWSSKINQFNFIPEDGMEVLVDGNIITWAPASKYQIIINNVELAGEGVLLKLVEDRKRKLQQEGLFDVSFKNKLHYIPNCIGIITSETGAAFRDIIKILRNRFPISILLYPVLVQGKGAAEEIYKYYANSVVLIGNRDKWTTGSGFFINHNGLKIITNWHVVEGTKKVDVWLKPKEKKDMKEVQAMTKLYKEAYDKLWNNISLTLIFQRVTVLFLLYCRTLTPRRF